MKMKKILAAAVVAALSVSVLTACGGSDKKVLKVATSADYPPYEFHQVVDGKDSIVGFEMEAIRYIGKQAGYDEVEIIDMDFNGLLAAVESGVADCAVAAMSVDEERLKNADFTDFYYTAEQLCLVRAEDKEKYSTFEGMKGAVVGVQNGTIHEQLMLDTVGDVEIKLYKKVTDMVMELENGTVDVLCLDGYVARNSAAKNDKIVVPDVSFGVTEGDKYAIAVKKGNTELLDVLNKGIADMLESGQMEEWVVEANEIMEQESQG
jgi:ABC-type amino acid transport substrate-binding protein